MYDVDMLISANLDSVTKDTHREDITSREEVLKQFTCEANDAIEWDGIPTSEEEFNIFVQLIRMRISNLNYDPSVFTYEEWEAIAKDIIAKAS